ncbi:hypothetical protein HYZ98_04690 [Candidatus Peregrinibacteria bacterium]|nr:hypothetical protein [Candidatus Peregrinibacteria bacterium]
MPSANDSPPAALWIPPELGERFERELHEVAVRHGLIDQEVAVTPKRHADVHPALKIASCSLGFLLEARQIITKAIKGLL